VVVSYLPRAPSTEKRFLVAFTGQPAPFWTPGEKEGTAATPYPAIASPGSL